MPPVNAITNKKPKLASAAANAVNSPQGIAPSIAGTGVISKMLPWGWFKDAASAFGSLGFSGAGGLAGEAFPSLW